MVKLERTGLVSVKKTLLFTLLVGLCAFALVRTATSSNLTTCHSCETSDCYGADYGAKKDTFCPDEDIYVTGTGFEPCSIFDIYVVNDQDPWCDGDAIPQRIAGTATTVSSDASGNILTTIVWPHDLTPGKYDIIIDLNGNGKYDEDVDCLDNNDIQVTAGFFVIPEYLLGTILGVAGFFAALGLFRVRARTKQ